MFKVQIGEINGTPRVATATANNKQFKYPSNNEIVLIFILIRTLFCVLNTIEASFNFVFSARNSMYHIFMRSPVRSPRSRSVYLFRVHSLDCFRQ